MTPKSEAPVGLPALSRPAHPTEGPPVLEVEVRSSLSGLDDATLDRITASASVFFDRRWFRMVESLDLPAVVGGDVALRYVVASAGSVPVAVCPFIVTRSPTVHLFYSLEKFFFTPWWLPAVRKHAPDKTHRAHQARHIVETAGFLARTLRAGVAGWVLAVSPLSHRADVAIAPMPEESAHRVRDLVVARLQEVAGAEDLPLCFLGLQEDERALRPTLAARGFEEVFLAYDNVLELSCASFDGYLGQFRSDARRLFRREIRTAHDAGVRFERTTGLAALGPVLEHLYTTTSRRYGADHFHHPPEYWSALERSLDGRAEAVVGFDRDGLAGFSLLLHKGSELWFHRVGRNYDSASSDSSVYFNLAFYEPVKRALELGAKRLWLGFGTWEAKRRRGATAHAIHSAFWFPSRWSRALLAPYLRTFGRTSRAAMSQILAPCSYVKVEPK